MVMSVRPLATPADLDAAVVESGRQPVVIFKHSLTCGTSAMGAEEVDDFAATAPAVPIYRLVVQQHRDLSREVERRFGIRHESPQLLLLSRGEVVWSGSHFRVTAEALQHAVGAAMDAAGTPS
jgi:bacillithiol system protein YtxJ